MKIEFKNSNLKATIIGVNNIEGLKRYETASINAIAYWNEEKENNHPRAVENINFFTEAVELCNSKIRKQKLDNIIKPS